MAALSIGLFLFAFDQLNPSKCKVSGQSWQDAISIYRMSTYGTGNPENISTLVRNFDCLVR